MGTLLITSLLSLQLLFSPYVLAAPSGTPRGQAIKDQAQVQNAERRATTTANLTEKRRERIINYFNRMVKRLDAAIARLEKLITRIESRIVKIEGENGDINTAPITEQVNEAKAMLENAKTELQTAKDNFTALLESNEPKEAFKIVRGNISSVKQMLIEVHRILVHVIGDLKGLRVGRTGSPGPSPIPSP